MELKTEVEERILHRLAKDNNYLEMWQGSRNLPAIQKELHVQK